MLAKRIKRKSEQRVRYIPLEDIKTIDDAFLNEINNVRMKLSGCDDENLINAFNEVLISGYKAAIEIKTLECEVDYEIRLAKLEARAAELKPIRRKRWIFRPYTNRAQDIIEERAELDAERIHSEEEKQNDAERERLFPEKEKKPSKREIRRKAREKLDEIIKEADKETSFEEPPTVPPVQESIAQDKKPLPGQMTFDEVQTQEQAGAPAKAEPAQEQTRPVPFTTSRRPRPPKACRKQ